MKRRATSRGIPHQAHPDTRHVHDQVVLAETAEDVTLDVGDGDVAERANLPPHAC